LFNIIYTIINLWQGLCQKIVWQHKKKKYPYKYKLITWILLFKKIYIHVLNTTNKMIKWISLFANVWIAETYMKDMWIDIVVANELLSERCNFYKYIYPECDVVPWDITKKDIYNSVLNKSLNNWVDFLIATPPCQWMSIAWMMNPDDPRNTLIVKAIDMILDTDVTYFLIENVPQALKTYIEINWEKVKIPDYIESRLWKKYNITYNILDASDYDTPQVRRRSIILWCKFKKREVPQKKEKITVEQAIWHLPSLESWQASKIAYHSAKKHNDNHILWMKNTATWKTALNNSIHYPQKDWRKIKWFLTTYKRISWDAPAPTITMANWSISSQNNVHPWRLLPDWTYSDARVLTLKEIFTLTWLPDNRKAPERASENLIRQIIWEGIPPKLIKNILKTIPKK